MNKAFRLILLLALPPLVLLLGVLKDYSIGNSLDRRAPDVRPRPELCIQGAGFIEPLGEVRKLVFKVNGVIAHCPAVIGGFYKQGDVLMELGNGEQKSEVALAEAELSFAESERNRVLAGINSYQIAAAARKVDSLSEQLRFCQKEHERARGLMSRNSLSRSEFDKTSTDASQGEAELRQAEAELDHLRRFVRIEDRTVADAKVSVAKARLDLARRRHEDTFLRAPFDGSVLEVLKREGEGARLFDSDPVAIYGDPSRLRVRGEVDERFISTLSVGRKAIISGRGLGKQSYEGRIVSIKGIMGKKTVFSRSATERKDLDVLQVMIEFDEPPVAPIGLEVDVKILDLMGG